MEIKIFPISLAKFHLYFLRNDSIKIEEKLLNFTKQKTKILFIYCNWHSLKYKINCIPELWEYGGVCSDSQSGCKLLNEHENDSKTKEMNKDVSQEIISSFFLHPRNLKIFIQKFKNKINHFLRKFLEKMADLTLNTE